MVELGTLEIDVLRVFLLAATAPAGGSYGSPPPAHTL